MLYVPEGLLILLGLLIRFRMLQWLPWPKNGLLFHQGHVYYTEQTLTSTKSKLVRIKRFLHNALLMAVLLTNTVHSKHYARDSWFLVSCVVICPSAMLHNLLLGIAWSKTMKHPAIIRISCGVHCSCIDQFALFSFWAWHECVQMRYRPDKHS